MTLKLNGSTSGYVTIDAPAVAGTTAITLPAVSGGSFIVSDSSGNVGIGTNTPATKLDVAGGGIMMRVGTSAGGNNLVQAYTDVSALGMWAGGAPRFYSTGSMRFSVNSTVGTSSPTGYTDAMTLDSSGNVGIGITSPGRLLSLYATQPVFQITNVASGSASTNGTIQYQVSGSTDFVLDNQGSGSGGVIRWMQAGSERMRIDSSGNLLVGTTTAVGAGNARATFQKDATGGDVVIVNANVSATFPTLISFRTQGTERGRVSTDGSTVTYNTTSDYRLKENVQPMTTGLATIGALKPVTYDWISDKSAGEGFIAHELQLVIPLAVTGEKDAVDDEGNIQPQGVDYSKIVVHLVAAIQEQQTVIEDLKSRIAVLESK